MSYRGDIALGDTVDLKFTTVSTTGVPTTLAGTPAVACYAGNGTTEITSGVTLTVDFDSRPGLHHVQVVASTGNGFAAGTNVDVVITAGTVGGTSVVGYVVGSFSIENRTSFEALNTITHAELGQAAPAATATLKDMIRWIYKLSRNKTTATASTISVFNDAGTTVDQKAAVSDDATTFTRDEFGAGP
jgi:hypothetical protein